MKSVARRIADGAVLRLIKLWLKAPIEERDGEGKRRMSGGKSNARGTPQGGDAVERSAHTLSRMPTTSSSSAVVMRARR